MSDFLVIAHRGASGYLPEHTLEGVAMAHAMGAHYIEQDAVLTQDDELIVVHDLYLDAVTNVAERFPARNRKDGHYYAIDFTLEEIRTLRVHERVGPDGRPVFRRRFPAGPSVFRIPTLAEEIELIRGLNISTGRKTGLYVEPKSPAWHFQQGKDVMATTIDLLSNYGYDSRNDAVFLQSFDMEALEHARHELKTDLKLVQLIGENSWQESETDFSRLLTERGLQDVAAFADGIGPWLPQVVEIQKDGSADISDLITTAHRLGLFVHAYTLRADQLPPAVGSMAAALEILVKGSDLDGVFSDHPDQVIRYLATVN